jgi:hypothetical protein
MAIWIVVCIAELHYIPRLHGVLQGLQARLDQVQRLEEQRGAGTAEGATHEGLESWMRLRGAWSEMGGEKRVRKKEEEG